MVFDGGEPKFLIPSRVRAFYAGVPAVYAEFRAHGAAVRRRRSQVDWRFAADCRTGRHKQCVADEETLLKTTGNKVAEDWSRDGKLLLYTESDPKTKDDVWLLSMSGDSKATPLLKTSFNESEARFSPDGKSVAYTSDESGSDQIYIPVEKGVEKGTGHFFRPKCFKTKHLVRAKRKVAPRFPVKHRLCWCVPLRNSRN
jgi:dipeptidyl aminopeptidase/acylaminoacyl peptidase